MTIESLISRLERVKRTGTGRYMARCPGHEDRTASLSVRELDDGRLLLHCFAGCGVGEVLGAVGMTMTDLFPERIQSTTGKSERRPFPAADVLRALALECQVVAVIATDIAAGVVIEPKAKDRVLLAAGRINAALDAAGVRHE